MAHALRVPMIGVSSLDLLAFPVRFSPRLIVAVIDARRGELFYAFYRQVPGGVQRLARAPRSAPPDDLAVGAPGHRRGRVCSSATARIRYREVFDGLASVEVADPATGLPVGARRWCSWPTPRRCARSGSAADEIEPLYLRKPDAEINWTDAGTSAT